MSNAARTPFFATDIAIYHSLANDFSPIDNSPAVYSDTEEDVFIKNGFLVKNATAAGGLVYVVTLAMFERAWSRVNKTLVTKATVLSTINPVAVYLASGQWLECLVVKVHDTGAPFASVVTHVNIGTNR